MDKKSQEMRLDTLLWPRSILDNTLPPVFLPLLVLKRHWFKVRLLCLCSCCHQLWPWIDWSLCKGGNWVGHCWCQRMHGTWWRYGRSSCLCYWVWTYQGWKAFWYQGGVVPDHVEGDWPGLWTGLVARTPGRHDNLPLQLANFQNQQSWWQAINTWEWAREQNGYMQEKRCDHVGWRIWGVELPSMLNEIKAQISLYVTNSLWTTSILRRL